MMVFPEVKLCFGGKLVPYSDDGKDSLSNEHKEEIQVSSVSKDTESIILNK